MGRRKNGIKFKILPEAPKYESELTQMITIGESIRQIWVNTEFEAETMKGQSSMPLGVHYPEMTEMYRHDNAMNMKMTQNSNMTTNCVHHAEMDIQMDTLIK